MTGRYHSEWTDRLSDYLADDLNGDTRTRLEEHLAECVPCREVLAQLREVVALAQGAQELRLQRDLWPSISASLESPGGSRERAEDGEVIALPTARRGPVRIALSPARLALTSAALVLVSVGATWWVASRAPVVGAASTLATGAAEGGLGTVGGAANAAGLTPEGAEPRVPDELAAQLGLLEELLGTARAALDPETVAVLERNLQTIETAIADSRRALEADPGNAFLAEHLERMYRRKVIYLQEAVRVAEWAS